MKKLNLLIILTFVIILIDLPNITIILNRSLYAEENRSGKNIKNTKVKDEKNESKEKKNTESLWTPKKLNLNPQDYNVKEMLSFTGNSLRTKNKKDVLIDADFIKNIKYSDKCMEKIDKMLSSQGIKFYMVKRHVQGSMGMYGILVYFHKTKYEKVKSILLASVNAGEIQETPKITREYVRKKKLERHKKLKAIKKARRKKRELDELQKELEFITPQP